jgi:hypothetical protein
MLHPSTLFSLSRTGKNPTAPNPVKRLDVAPASINLPSDHQSCTWRYAGLHDPNAPPFFTSDLQGSLMVDSARLQRECWSTNTENQNESRSAEFQQGNGPVKDRKRSAFVLEGLSVVLFELAPLLHQESTCGHVL